jgi:hypothetical protein
MSHTHRDEADKVEGVGAARAGETVVAPATRSISNAEAERKAKEKRDADGIEVDIDAQRKFLGGADGTEDGAPRLLTIDEREQRALVHAAARTHRGPPAPRHAEVGDEVSWIAQGHLGDLAYLEDQRGAPWVAEELTPARALLVDDLAASWIRGGAE